MPLPHGVVPDSLQHELRDGGVTLQHERRAEVAAYTQRSRRELVLYIFFLGCLSLICGRGLLDPHTYHFSRRLRTSLAGPHTTFSSVRTLNDVDTWLEGSLVDALFTTGDRGSALDIDRDSGYSRVLGSVRVAQLRSKPFDCTADNEGVPSWQRYECYGESSAMSARYGGWTSGTEAKAAFGAGFGSLSQSFEWEGQRLILNQSSPTSTATAAFRTGFGIIWIR